MNPEATTAVKLLAEALLHNLWQGAILAALLLFVLRWVPARSAQLRYWASVVTLLLLVFSVPVTVAVLSVMNQEAPNHEHSIPALSNPATSAEADPSQHSCQVCNPIEVVTIESTGHSNEGSPFIRSLAWQQWFVVFWLLGSVAGMFRVFRAAFGVRRLRKEASPLTEIGTDELGKRCGFHRRIPIFESAQVASACICGFFRPVILLPLSLATQLTSEQLQVVIVHEFAHLKRLDPFWNLCQLLAEALLFFNPFLWWISESIRNEREACCDEFVLQATGRKREYLEALLKSSETALEGVLTGAIAFSGNNKDRSPLARVRRILKPNAVPEVRVRFSLLVGLILSLVASGWLIFTASQFFVSLETDDPSETVFVSEGRRIEAWIYEKGYQEKFPWKSRQVAKIVGFEEISVEEFKGDIGTTYQVAVMSPGRATYNFRFEELAEDRIYRLPGLGRNKETPERIYMKDELIAVIEGEVNKVGDASLAGDDVEEFLYGVAHSGIPEWIGVDYQGLQAEEATMWQPIDRLYLNNFRRSSGYGLARVTEEQYQADQIDVEAEFKSINVELAAGDHYFFKTKGREHMGKFRVLSVGYHTDEDIQIFRSHKRY